MRLSYSLMMFNCFVCLMSLGTGTDARDVFPTYQPETGTARGTDRRAVEEGRVFSVQINAARKRMVCVDLDEDILEGNAAQSGTQLLMKKGGFNLC